MERKSIIEREARMNDLLYLGFFAIEYIAFFGGLIGGMWFADYKIFIGGIIIAIYANLRKNEFYKKEH
jgi:hypothetical protein